MRHLFTWVYVISSLAICYETWALSTGAITISRFTRDLAEEYHPVYWFGGIVTGFMIIIQLRASGVPQLVKVTLLLWTITSAHIFWGLYDPPKAEMDKSKTTQMMSEN